MDPARKPVVVIIGAGFGGLAAARGLRNSAVEVVVIDRSNHHTFQPLLYQVATAGLSAPQIASPIRHILRSQKNARVLLGEAIAVDTAGKRVVLVDGEMEFDYLIVAAGLTHSYFGNSAWAEHAPGLKTLDDALEIRRRILIAFERAEREPDAVKRAAWLTFVIIGGGPTGVELAGTLAEIARHTLTDEFRRIDPAKARVLLLEGGSRILNTFPEVLSEKAARQLQKLGVEVHVGALVSSVDAEGVTVNAGGDNRERITARTVLWAAGVQATALAKILPGPHDRTGRVLVTPTLQLTTTDSIFVIGDLASVAQDGKQVPGVAYAAKQMGSYVAHEISQRVTSDGLHTNS
ncbi:MAG TPA: NAD(P)/FAD-dependent oxidoreductase, partial [Burkholderiaceae bacterium]|nr:NAD(P)/FAD-dependent oxidoreductase [Burkholderiaceae bacterium]